MGLQLPHLSFLYLLPIGKQNPLQKKKIPCKILSSFKAQWPSQLWKGSLELMTRVPEDPADPAKWCFVWAAFSHPSFNSALVGFCKFFFWRGGRLVVVYIFLNYFSKPIICNFLKNNIINKHQLNLYCLPC